MCRGLFVREWTEWRRASCVFLCKILVFVILLIAGAVKIERKASAMRQGHSTPSTALECSLNNFSDFQNRARGYGGPPPDPETLRTLSELEWPTFNVRWPTEGTFDLPLLFAVRRVVYGTPHPDQMIYIDVWVDIATDRPGYIRRCQSNRQRRRRAICVATAPRQMPRAPAEKGRQPQGNRAGGGGTKLYPVLPEIPEDPLLAPSAPPPYHQPLPDSSSGEMREIRSPPHTRSGTQYGGETLAPKPNGAAILGQAPHPGGAAILPLREVPPAPDAPSHAPPRLVYVPFSTSDLYNWKLQNPPFSEKPQGLISLLETIFRTHQHGMTVSRYYKHCSLQRKEIES